MLLKMTWAQDNAIHWINHYPVYNTGLPNTYPVDGYLSVENTIQHLNKQGQILQSNIVTFMHQSLTIKLFK